MSRGDRILRRSPAQWAFRARSRGRLAVLGYHGIDDPDLFARHMDYVAQRMRPVTIQQAEDALLRAAPLPPHAVLVTFDDAERSLLERGLPILRERGIPGLVFAIAGLVGTDQPYWWAEVEALVRNGGHTDAVGAREPRPVVQEMKTLTDAGRLAAIEELRASAPAPAPRMPQLSAYELRELVEGGVALANHTLDHPCLHRCEPDEMARQIAEGGRRLEEISEGASRWLAYPNGYYDDRVLDAARRSGVRLAFSFDHRTTPYPAPDPILVSRLRVESTMPVERFELITADLIPTLLRARDRALGRPD